jgi:hypothetical protein
MSTTLPVISASDRCLADVLVSSFASVRGVDNPLGLGRVRRSVVVLVDGLGSDNLAHRAAHARTLTGLRQRSVSAGFPTTTASALSSLMTGADPGISGMVGYAVRDPATGVIVNQLSGLDAVDVSNWQPIETVWEVNSDVPTAIVSSSRYRHSGLTRAILRGADYVSAQTYDERLAAVDSFVRLHRDGVVYVYVPELDMTAHASGVGSQQWARRLEEFDGFISDLQKMLSTNDGLVVTADHGVIDVPSTKHLLIPAESALLDGVVTGGEPRFLHLYVDGDASAKAEEWRNAEGTRAYVATRDEAIEAGWFGTVSEEHRGRIGDVLVTPRGQNVYYDERVATTQSMSMIGQHGGLSRAETHVPLIFAGAFA